MVPHIRIRHHLPWVLDRDVVSWIELRVEFHALASVLASEEIVLALHSALIVRSRLAIGLINLPPLDVGHSRLHATLVEHDLTRPGVAFNLQHFDLLQSTLWKFHLLNRAVQTWWYDRIRLAALYVLHLAIRWLLVDHVVVLGDALREVLRQKCSGPFLRWAVLYMVVSALRIWVVLVLGVAVNCLFIQLEILKLCRFVYSNGRLLDKLVVFDGLLSHWEILIEALLVVDCCGLESWSHYLQLKRSTGGILLRQEGLRLDDLGDLPGNILKILFEDLILRNIAFSLLFSHGIQQSHRYLLNLSILIMNRLSIVPLRQRYRLVCRILSRLGIQKLVLLKLTLITHALPLIRLVKRCIVRNHPSGLSQLFALGVLYRLLRRLHIAHRRQLQVLRRIQGGILQSLFLQVQRCPHVKYRFVVPPALRRP